MKFKKSISVLIAVITVLTAFFVSPAGALEEGETAASTACTETAFEQESSSEESSSFEESTAEESTAEAVTEPEPVNPTEPASEPVESAMLKVRGKTVHYNNKCALRYINAYRVSSGRDKYKNDKALTETAYKRAAMLAVDYSRKQPVKKPLEMSSKAVYAKGDYTALVKKYKSSKFRKDKKVNVCGIANLKVGGETLWALILDTKEKTDIEKVTEYSKKTVSYSSSDEYKLSLLKGRAQLGDFKTKTVRYKKNKKYSGQLNLTNYQDDINSYFKVNNTDKHTPVEYSTKDSDVASVSSYGNVKALDYSAYKEKSRYTPKKGDFILFHWYPNDGYLASHVGVVYKVTRNNIVTIEGNTGNNDYRKSIVSKRVYKNYKKNYQIIGFVDISKYIGRDEAEELAELAKKQLGKRGSKFYYHTKAWKDVMGSYEPAHWCAIFCGWLLEQMDYDPVEDGRWSPSCTMWIRQCHARATAKIKAKIKGSKKTYSYKVTFKV